MSWGKVSAMHRVPQLYDLVLPDAYGSTIDLGRYQGRRLVMFVWASW
jgi:hypothetical protein